METVGDEVRGLAEGMVGRRVDVAVNHADDTGPYLTPFRPMSLAACAGKNPVSHVGSTYQGVAHDTVGGSRPDGSDRSHYSRIGDPVSRPQTE